MTETKLPYSFVAFFHPFLLNAFLVRSAFVPLENWYLEWGISINDGKLPYQEFYVPFPPLYVYLGAIIARLPDPVLSSHIIALIVQSLLGLGLFRLVDVFFERKKALLISVFCVTYWSIHPTDLIGGYFEFAVMLTCWSTLGIVYFLRASDYSKALVFLTPLSLSSLVKQNFLLFWFVVAIYVMVVVNRKIENEDKLYRLHLNFKVLFFLNFNYLVFASYLLIEGIFDDFIRIMLQAGGKNPDLIIWMKNLVINVITPRFLIPSVLFLLSLSIMNIVSRKWKPKEDDRPRSKISLIAFLCLSLATCSMAIKIVTFGLGKIAWDTWILIAFLSALILATVLVSTKFEKHIETALVVVISSGFLNIFLFDLEANYPEIFYTYLGKDTFLTSFSHQMWILAGAISWLIVFLFVISTMLLSPMIKKKQRKNMFRSRLRQLYNRATLVTKKALDLGDKGPFFKVLLIALLASDLLNAVNGGFFTDGSIILVGLVLARVFEIASEFFAKLLPIALAVILFFGAPTMVTIVHSWFFWGEYKNPSKHTALESMRNMKITTDETRLYEEISHVVKTLDLENNDDIVSLPAQPTVTRIITNNWEHSSDLYCPILWIDICNEKAAEFTFKQIRDQKPKVVIFFDFGQEAARGFSFAYRDKPTSAMYEILGFLATSPDYQLIANIENRSMLGTNAKIFVRSS